MSVFSGCCTALITPFDKDGINYDTVKRLIDFQIHNNVSALLICGTTGEPSTMTHIEKCALINFTIKYVNGRLPVIVGTGSNSTSESVKDSIFAYQAGADALLVVTPYYNRCTQLGLVEHYKQIASNVDIPIIVYNVPSRTGVNILPYTAARLSNIKNIVAIKEACGNIEQIVETTRLTRGKLDIYSGDDAITLPLMSIGALGVISVVSNIAPNKVVELCAAIEKNNFVYARQLQDEIKDLTNALFSEVNPIPTKAALQLMGFDVGIPRLPLTQMENSTKKELYNVLVNHNLIYNGISI